MLPNNALSTEPYPAPFDGIRKIPTYDYLEDKETINIPVTQFVYEFEDWYGTCDGSTIILSSEGESDIVAVTDTDITEFSFTFTQNKTPVVTYVSEGVTKLKWFDIVEGGIVTTAYDDTYLSPRVSLDDKHRLANNRNDVIFAYIRAGALRYRQQRDRYLTEYTQSAVGPDVRIRRIGMNAGNRFQFELYRQV